MRSVLGPFAHGFRAKAAARKCLSRETAARLEQRQDVPPQIESGRRFTAHHRLIEEISHGTERILRRQEGRATAIDTLSSLQILALPSISAEVDLALAST